MRAIMFAGPSAGSDKTHVVDVDEPAPGPGQVAVDVSFAGLNFVDVMARRGDAGYVTQWPYTPGAEVAGLVREIGAGVTGFRIGQPVVGLTLGGGALAEVAVVDAALAVPIPDRAAIEAAVSAPIVATTALMLVRDAARFRPGERVLVHSAAGAVGAAVASVVRVLGGGTLVGTVGSAAKIEAARAAGYDQVVLRGGGFAQAGPVDAVLDANGPATWDEDLRALSPGGRLVLFGNAAGGPLAALPDATRLLRGNLGVVGFSVSSLARTVPDRYAQALRDALDLVAEGKVTMAVTTVPSLDQVASAHDAIASGQTTGKWIARVR